MEETTSVEPHRRGVTLLDIALVVAENLRTLIVVPVAAGVVALIVSFFIAPTFTAAVRILPPVQQQSTSAASAALLGAIAGYAGASLGMKNPSDQLVALLKSQTVNDAIVKRFDLKKLYEVDLTVDARRTLQSRTRINASPKDGVITIEVDDHDPKRAADIANAFVEELHDLSKSLAVTEAAQRRLFFEEQLKQAKSDLTKAEIALRTSGLSEGSLKAEPRSALELLARLKAQITAQEVKVASMRAFMTESNPEFRIALQELGALRAEARRLEQNAPAVAGANGAEYITRFRDFKYHEALFDLMLKQYDLARLDEAREGTVVQVMDAAQPPERKSKPSKASVAILTTAIAFVFTLLFVFIRHALRSMAAEASSAEKLERLRYLLRLRRLLSVYRG